MKLHLILPCSQTIRFALARAASGLEAESAGSIHRFLESRLDVGGAFLNRAGKPDLYYTVFGIECAVALGMKLPFPRVEKYLRLFNDGVHLDFIHRICLARCWSRMEAPHEPSLFHQRIEEYRTPDAGFHQKRGASHGSVYETFLAMLSYQDFGLQPPNPSGMARCVERRACRGGGYANDPEEGVPTTPVTAAALALLHNLGGAAPKESVAWLLARRHAQGGFLAAEGAPLPDLLSTATALHALTALGLPVDSLRKPCMEFVESLWSDDGGFRGHPADSVADCEYTFHGLLALGSLM